MAHQLLDRAEIDAGHREPACEGVTEIMPAEARDACLLQGWLENSAHVVPGIERRLAGGTWEDHRTLHAARQRAEDVAHDVVHRDPPELARLRPRDGDDPRPEVDVLPAQVKLLGLPEASVDRDYDHGAIGFLELLEKAGFFVWRQEPDAGVVLLPAHRLVLKGPSRRKEPDTH